MDIKKKIISTVVVILVCLIFAMVGHYMGVRYESLNNMERDNETIFTELYGDFSTIDYLMDRWIEEMDDFGTEIKHHENYTKLLIEVEELKGTLELSNQISYNNGIRVPYKELNDSMELAFSVIEGVAYKNTIISSDFFEDDGINDQEANYIKDLSEDLRKVTTTLMEIQELKNGREQMEIFTETIEIFTDKYSVGDELMKLIVDN